VSDFESFCKQADKVFKVFLWIFFVLLIVSFGFLTLRP